MPDIERSLAGKAGIQTRLSREDPVEMTQKARSSFRDSFYAQTDPALPEAERRRRAEAAWRAHMAELTRRSVASRRRAARLRQEAAAAAAEAEQAAADLTDACADAV